MADCLSRHPLFERIPDEDLKDDICFKTMFEATEEGQKVTRNKGQKWPAVFKRLPNPEWKSVMIIEVMVTFYDLRLE